jgi:LuxR family transcriptional regulator
MSSAELSPRQHECLQHTANGLVAKETARAMGVSVWTVKDLRSAVIAKLGAKNIVHAVVIAAGRGLIEEQA